MLDLKTVRDDPEGVKAALAKRGPGAEEDSVELRRVGTPHQFDFPVRDHLELGELLGAIDTARAAKVSGTRFGYLTGPSRSAAAARSPRPPRTSASRSWPASRSCPTASARPRAACAPLRPS